MYKTVALFAACLWPLMHYTSARTVWVEVKPSYFLFTAAPMKHIYNHGGFQLQGSVSVPCCTYLDLYGSIGYRKAWGHALNTGEKTNLGVLPVDIGLKPIFTIRENCSYFFAVGPRYFYLHQNNCSPYVDCSITGNGIGIFVNTGFNLLLAEHLLLGIFGEYSYEKKAICPQKPYVFSNGATQIGGFAVGINVGYSF